VSKEEKEGARRTESQRKLLRISAKKPKLIA
jgi:hypothetical protein